MRKYSTLELYRRLIGQARPVLGFLVALFGLRLLSTPLVLLAPLPLKIAVDSAIGSEPLPAALQAVLPDALSQPGSTVLFVAVGMLLVIALLTHIHGLVDAWLYTYTAERMVLSFRSSLFQQVQRLSLTYHDSRGTADSIYRVQQDSSSIRYILTDGVIPFVTALVTLVSMLYVTFRIDAQLALIAVAVAPLLLVLGPAYRRRLRRQSHEVKSLESAAQSVVQEVLTGIRLVKAFGQEEREQKRFVDRSRQGMRARVGLAVVGGSLGMLVGLTTAVGMSAVLFVGVRNVQAGALTLGSLLLVMGYLTRLYEPLRTVSKKIASLQTHLASAERALAILDEDRDVPDRPDAKRLTRARGRVAFDDVCFSYDGRVGVLHHVSCELEPGTRVGIAGRTGAGKTTLISLVMRFHDATSGRILLDGEDLRGYRLADLRDQFAVVLQDPILFSTTVEENIAYGRPGASRAEIVEAARAANAHDFIEALPDGYRTQVGERGMRLSGGERQRIALARAFLKDAPVLVLDEPTSSVDIATEALILEAMHRLMDGRTTFLIAHRLETLRSCDMLLVLERGRIATVGTDVPRAVDDVVRRAMLETTPGRRQENA